MQKAIRAGHIPVEPDGTVDPAKADAAWKRATDPGRTWKPEAARPAPGPASGPRVKPVSEAALYEEAVGIAPKLPIEPRITPR